MRPVDANHKRNQLHWEETAGRLKSVSGRSAASRGRDRLHLSLRQAVQTIGTAESLETVLDQLMSTIQTVFHCDVSLVYIIDESEQQLVPHVSARVNQDDGTAAPSDTNLTPQSSAAKPAFPKLQLAECCQRLQLSPFRWPSNEGKPARQCALFDTLHSAGFSTWFSIPLSAGKHTIGFIAVGYFHYQYLFDDAGQILWEFAQDVTRALLPHLSANIRETNLNPQEAVDLPSLYQQERMRRLLANHHELTHTLWTDDKLPAIVESLSFIVHQPVALLDSFLHPITTYPADIPWNKYLPSLQRWMTLRHNESHIRLPLSVRTDLIDGETFVITPVQMGSAMLGYLAVWERGARLDDLDVMALQQSTTILAVHFYKHGLHIERLGHGFSELFSTLLDNPENWDDAYTAQALDIGWDVTAPQCILVAKPLTSALSAPLTHDSLQGYLEQLRIRLAADYPDVLVTRHQGHFVFTVPGRFAKDEPVSQLIAWTQTIDAIPRSITSNPAAESGNDESACQRLTLSFGLSDIVQSPFEIANAYAQARTAAALAPVVGDGQLFVREADVRVYLLLQPVASTSATQRFTLEQLSPLEAYDRQHQTELIKTLRLFLHHNGNLTDTAQALYIHRTSLQYRLNRIEGLLSRSLEDARNRLEVQLALVFRDLDNAASGPNLLY